MQLSRARRRPRSPATSPSPVPRRGVPRPPGPLGCRGSSRRVWPCPPPPTRTGSVTQLSKCHCVPHRTALLKDNTEGHSVAEVVDLLWLDAAQSPLTHPSSPHGSRAVSLPRPSNFAPSPSATCPHTGSGPKKLNVRSRSPLVPASAGAGAERVEPSHKGRWAPQTTARPVFRRPLDAGELMRQIRTKVSIAFP